VDLADLRVSRSLQGWSWLIRATEGKEILCALDGFLKATEKLLQVFAAFDKIDFGGVDDQKIGACIAEEKMFVGARDLLDVVGGDLLLLARFLFGNACAENLRLGLEIDDEVRFGEFEGKGLVVSLVEFQLGVVEIEIGENTVFLHQEIGNDGTGGITSEGFADAFLALHEEIELSVKGGTGFFGIEIGEEGVVLAVINTSSMETLGEDAGEGGLADT